MSYETTEHVKTYKGQAIAGLTLGIIGTALGLGAGNGCWNILGNGNGGFFGGCGNRAEAEQSRIAAMGSEIAELRSQRYTDYVGMDLYKNIVAFSNAEDAKIRDLQKEVTAYVIDLDKRVALNEQAMILNRQYDQLARDAGFKLLEQKLDCCCDKANIKIDNNAQLTALADQSILSYINATFLPGTLKLPITSICPEPATSTTTA
jgi:hypothetical protein